MMVPTGPRCKRKRVSVDSSRADLCNHPCPVAPVPSHPEHLMAPSAPRTPDDRPLSIGDPDRIRRAREVLDKAGFDLAGLVEVLGPEPPSLHEDLARSQRPRLLRLCRDSSPREVLIRLFILGAAVRESDARRAVAPMDLAEWEELGLLQRDGDSVRALAEVLPGDDRLMAAVPDPARRSAAAG